MNLKEKRPEAVVVSIRGEVDEADAALTSGHWRSSEGLSRCGQDGPASTPPGCRALAQDLQCRGERSWCR